VSTMEMGLSETETRESLVKMSSMWWIWLVTGICWFLLSLIILQFDQSAVRTIGVLVGLMFLFTGVEQLVLAAMTSGGMRAFWIIFGVLFIIGGFVAIFDPAKTFAAIADVLGFLFLLVGIFWVIEALVTKAANQLWWLGLTAGILMVLLAFWTSAQTFSTKAYMLLVFAGIWAMLHGITDMVKAFMVRSLRNEIEA
jgi:uncharacterized membrane protein HdeD (DUF308 family)